MADDGGHADRQYQVQVEAPALEVDSAASVSFEAQPTMAAPILSNLGLDRRARRASVLRAQNRIESSLPNDSDTAQEETSTKEAVSKPDSMSFQGAPSGTRRIALRPMQSLGSSPHSQGGLASDANQNSAFRGKPIEAKSHLPLPRRSRLADWSALEEKVDATGGGGMPFGGGGEPIDEQVTPGGADADPGSKPSEGESQASQKPDNSSVAGPAQEVDE